MKFDTWREFFEPFECFCCGKEISKIQFKFSALCGYCDLGKCQRDGFHFEGGHDKKGMYKKGKIVPKLAIIESLK